MPRPYKLGKRKVSIEVFDAEVLRLVGLGLQEREIGQRLGGASRWTVGRSIKRLKKRQPDQVKDAKTTGEYQRLSLDSFRGLPEIVKWIDNFKARGVGWKPAVNTLKRICDVLEIYPSMLDGDWAQKWLVQTVENRSKAQMRVYKLALRGWLKFALKMSDNDLQVLGLDAKHYEVGKWATVRLSEPQIEQAIQMLGDQPKALLAFRLGAECCCPLQELQRMRRSDYLKEEGILRTFRAKTGSFWSKYPSKITANLIMSNETERLFTKGDIDHIYQVLRFTFAKVGATVTYFDMHPLHALRHVGAQRLLVKTNWNRAVVAMLGGWNAEKTLEDHYGAVPSPIIHKIGGSLW